jgi:primosomal protein N' (replication factor Y)
MEQDLKTYFLDVILPIAIPKTMTYRLPRSMEGTVEMGMRVVVQLGKSKLYTGIVHRVHEEAPSNYSAKYIEGVLDEFPIVTPKLLKFWEWMSAYYACTLGEVMSAGLPSSLKLASETKIVLNDGHEDRLADELSDKEFLIVEALEMHKELDIKDLMDILQQQTVLPYIKSLIEKSWITTREELRQKYKPKTQTMIGLNPEYQNDAQLEMLVNELEKGRGSKQLEAVMGFLREANNELNILIPRKELQDKAGVSSSITKALFEKGIFSMQEVAIDRMKFEESVSEEKALSDFQIRALGEIKTGFEEKGIVLLQGVTGSGKTEVYVHLIREHLDAGEQVLFLIPEIALTTQLIQRLEKYFGEYLLVYHSKFNPQERTEVWQKTLAGGPKLIVGARSSIFLPFDKLGLIIVDEEHESSFKQYDPAPRYQARDAVMVLRSAYNAHVLLGSATPSIESFWNAEQGRYALVVMKERFGGLLLPEIFCADVAKETKKRTMKGHFSFMLREAMEEVLKNGKQIILFQNRRGYAPLWQCSVCGWVPQCTRCDVSLTYHKREHHLNCHYCGHTTHPPATCTVCGSHSLKNLGFGTEMIEEELKDLFPDAKVARMDLDTTRSKHAYQNILSDFDEGKVDILVGTQMVSKGLDFENVALVGILSADQMLNFPDFRSFERSYQLMTQVSGRSGRKHERGKVIIQTYNPEHWVIRKVIDNDYEALYKQELVERYNYKYPPYYRLIRVTMKHKDEKVVQQAARDFTATLINMFGKERVIGPEAPYISRINNKYIQLMMVKLERKASPAKFKQSTLDTISEFLSIPAYKALRIQLDVDPQ